GTAASDDAAISGRARDRFCVALVPRQETRMPFSAECPFCRLTLQNVPDRYAGASRECPRCRNAFTLAAMTSPPAAVEQGPRLASRSQAASLGAAPSLQRKSDPER